MNSFHFGKIIIVVGLGLVVLGLIFMALQRIPFIGKLPGDLYIQRKNFSFYFPIATCILASIVISLLLWIFTRK